MVDRAALADAAVLVDPDQQQAAAAVPRAIYGHLDRDDPVLADQPVDADPDVGVCVEERGQEALRGAGADTAGDLVVEVVGGPQLVAG